MSRIHFLTAFIVFLISFIVAYFFIGTINNAGSNQNTIQAITTPGTNEDELLLIYLGSSVCNACSNEELPGNIKKLIDMTREQADLNNLAFSTIGISKDWNIKKGIEHLNKISVFDEITTGKSWMNSLIARYAFDEFPSRVATPQVIISLRNYGAYKNNDIDFFHGIDEERVMKRFTGLHEISKATSETIEIKF